MESLQVRTVVPRTQAAEIVFCGQLACIALKKSLGVANPLDGFAHTRYVEAAGEILWVGVRLAAMHPRAVVTSCLVPQGTALRFEAIPECGWSPCLPVLSDSSRSRVRAAAQELATALKSVPPRGFGAWLSGQPFPFPLNLAALRVRRLWQAYANDDCEAVLEASKALVGIGSGLTPSGDDLIGAAWFGRQWITHRDPCWTTARESLVKLFGDRSHRLSAALSGDLVRGESFAALHDLAQALAAGTGTEALTAARRLLDIGHSSGWDMLTGFLMGVTA